MQFHKLFGPLVGHKDYKPRLWRSGSIHKTTNKKLYYTEAFREIVRTVNRNITNPASIAYDNVISKLNQLRKAKKISGIGENIVTEILLSFDPVRFANLDENPLTVLSLVAKDFPNISSFKGSDYDGYIALLTQIRDELEMHTFLEIDSFLINYIGT